MASFGNKFKTIKGLLQKNFSLKYLKQSNQFSKKSIALLESDTIVNKALKVSEEKVNNLLSHSKLIKQYHNSLNNTTSDESSSLGEISSADEKDLEFIFSN